MRTCREMRGLTKTLVLGTFLFVVLAVVLLCGVLPVLFRVVALHNHGKITTAWVIYVHGGSAHGRDGDEAGPSDSSVTRVAYEYSVGDAFYTATTSAPAVSRLENGDRFPICYLPEHPEISSADPNFDASGIGFTCIGLILALIFLGALGVHSLVKARREAILAAYHLTGDAPDDEEEEEP